MTLFQAFGQFAGAGAAPAFSSDWYLLTPSSVGFVGSSATIGANGGISFSGVSTLNVNGVFSSTYEFYCFIYTAQNSGGGTDHSFRLRAAGTDDSTSNSYVFQNYRFQGSTLNTARTTNNAGSAGVSRNSPAASGGAVYVMSPAQAIPTTWFTEWLDGEPSVQERSGTHNQSTAYDGFSIYTSSGSITLTGNMQVYGMAAAV